MRRDGVEPPEPEGGWVTATEACQCPTDACLISDAGGSRTHKDRRFELPRFASLRTASSQAPSTGFEPAISCVTGRRALRTAPRGRKLKSVAQVGFEPTASLVLSQGGLPVAYRAMSIRAEYPEQDSNLQTLGFKPSRSASWRIWASSRVVPDGIEPPFLECEPSVVAVGPRDCVSGLTGSCTRILSVRS